MLLYHWTLKDHLPGIKANGLRNSTYSAESGLGWGVWLSEDPRAWCRGTEVLIEIDFPDSDLFEVWRSALTSHEWSIPEEFLAGVRLRVAHQKSALE